VEGFAHKEIDGFLAGPDFDDRANLVGEVPEHPVTKPGDVWVMEGQLFPMFEASESEERSFSLVLNWPALVKK
jgi:hypothetical protein